MASLTLNAVNNKKIIPSNNTAVKANWYEYPIDKTTVYAKNAFNPIPGANANGNFAYNPITNVAIIDDKAVAVNTAPESIPAADKILGLTTSIYAIVINVVIPAINSCFVFVLFSLSLK